MPHTNKHKLRIHGKISRGFLTSKQENRAIPHSTSLLDKMQELVLHFLINKQENTSLEPYELEGQDSHILKASDLSSYIGLQTPLFITLDKHLQSTYFWEHSSPW